MSIDTEADTLQQRYGSQYEYNRIPKDAMLDSIELMTRIGRVRAEMFVEMLRPTNGGIPPLHCFKEYQMALVGLEEMNMMAQSSVYEEPDWIVKEKIELQYRIEMFKQKHSLK